MAELFKEVVSDIFKEETQYYQNERKKYISQITEQNNRLTKSRELLLTDAIDASDYKLIKSECEEKIAKLEAELKDFVTNSLKLIA
nr:recombinase family protein [Bacteroidota bacterium]